MTPDVPAFPGFRKITIADKGSFDTYFSKYPPDLSERTFTNFFIWRECDRSQVTLINGNPCVAAFPENEPPYFFEPLGDNRIRETLHVCLSRVPRFSRVSEGFMKEYFEGKEGFKIELDRDHCDYVYSRDDLIDLKGRKYDGKRNKIRRFLKSYIPLYEKLTEDNAADCLRLLGRWKKAKAASLCLDAPIKETLVNFSKLNVKGAIVKVNGAVEAFTIGERLNDDTAVIYIEVANPQIDGLSQYINQQFCLREWGQFKHINREEDLGDTGLRRAKLSYHPIKLMNKYNVTFI